MKKNNQKTDRFGPKTTIVMVSAAMFAVFTVGTSMFGFFSDSERHRVLVGDLSYLAVGAAVLVDGDAHNTIRGPIMAGRKVHEAALAPLVAFQNAVPSITRIYTLIERGEGVSVILDTSASNRLLRPSAEVPVAIGTPFTDVPQDRLNWIKVMRSGIAFVGSGFAEDDLGQAIKTAAPFRDSSGEIAGFIALDMADEFFKDRHWSKVGILAVAFGIGLVAALLGGGYTHLALTGRGLRPRNLFRLATIDSVSGVANRHFFITSVEEELARYRRHGASMGYMVVRIDGLNAIRRINGRAVGDRIMKTTGKLIDDCLREVDHVGRVGADEFAILLCQTDIEGTRIVAARLFKLVSDAVVSTPDGTKTGYSLSMGLTAVQEGDQVFDDLHTRATRALYAAGEKGPGEMSVA